MSEKNLVLTALEIGFEQRSKTMHRRLISSYADTSTVYEALPKWTA